MDTLVPEVEQRYGGPGAPKNKHQNRKCRTAVSVTQVGFTEDGRGSPHLKRHK